MLERCLVFRINGDFSMLKKFVTYCNLKRGTNLLRTTQKETKSGTKLMLLSLLGKRFASCVFVNYML